MISTDKAHKPKLRLIRGGRKTERIPVINDAKPVKPLLVTWPGGKLRKGSS